MSEYIKHISDYFVNLLLHHSMSAASTPIYPAATCQYLPELFTVQELIPATSQQVATLPGEVLNCQGSIPCLHLKSTLSPLQFTTVLNLFPASNHQVSTPSMLHLLSIQKSRENPIQPHLGQGHAGSQYEPRSGKEQHASAKLWEKPRLD